MNLRTFGRTGLRVSEIGFGGAPLGIRDYIEAWEPEGESESTSAIAAIHCALDQGINYFDTAPGYGDGASERLMGRALAGRRDGVILATKTGARDRDGIRRSVEASLQRLGTDCIDVIQFHGGWYPPEETERILGEGLPTLQALRDEGKVRFLGFTAEGPSGGASRLVATGAFDVLQARYNIMYGHTCDYVNEAGLMREAEAQGMGIVTMRTLTSGTFQKLMQQCLPEAAGRLGLDRLLLGYVLSNPFVDVALVGMRRSEEVLRNVALAADESARIDLAELHYRFAK